jgi:hypothetical protein
MCPVQRHTSGSWRASHLIINVTLSACACIAPCSVITIASAQAPPSLGGCPMFPINNVWNTPIDTLPVDANSAAYISTIGPNTGLHPDFGTVWKGAPNGIPYVIVPANQPLVPVSFLWADESDPGPYPIPPDPPIEGGPDGEGDRHILILHQGECKLYELFYAFPKDDGSGGWHASSGAIFDLNSNALRPDTWTSADAAGLPMLPGLVRYEEAVVAGEIRHALRFTCSPTRDDHIWPARHDASSSTNPAHPPMGQRFRLKADFDIAPYPAEVQVILRALKKYGMILADNGSDWYISGVPNPLWEDDALSQISGVRGSDFEAVDESSIMVDPDSGEAQLCVGDIDGNLEVDVDDLVEVILTWGFCDVCPPDIAPHGGNGTVDVDDLVTVILGWGPCE